MSIPSETFPALAAAGGTFRHAFLGRVPGLDVCTDRETALARLAALHAQARRDLGMGTVAFVTAEQVHGAEVAMVDAGTASPVAGVDALITNRPGVCLGIYVADCCAVYVADPEHACVGLAHSGRKGTELGIVPAMIQKMRREFGTDPARVIVQLSPCIRPPLDEVDFAAEIVRQCHAMGVHTVADCGVCTGQNRDRYYSYRMEKGRTGRMLALLSPT